MSTWQPIDTAPRDGTPVLVWNGRKIWKSSQRLDEHDDGHHPVYGPGNGHEWFMAGERDRPTHWIPLPEPPTP